MATISQEEFTTSVKQITRNLERAYDEMYDDEVILKRIEGTKADSIKRLAEYYQELHKIGAFIEEETGAKRDLNEVCGVIEREMEKRMFTPKTVMYVWEVLPDKYKRAWRNTTKVGNPTNVAAETETKNLYDKFVEHINELDNLDYMEFPKGFRQQLGERVYKMYRHHDNQWTKYGLRFIKNQDGLNINDPYADIIRLHKGKPYRGMAMVGLQKHIKTCKEVLKIYHTMVYGKDGDRKLTLEQERTIYNGWATFDGYLLPDKNNKWKRDFLGWCKIYLKRFSLKSKSGAAKWSRKEITMDNGEKIWRGIVREEITKNQRRMVQAFRDFIYAFPPLLIMHQAFIWGMEPGRAKHSIDMHDKLSQSA